MISQENIDKMSFEEALAELEKIVRRIDSGEEKLADAVSAYELGVALKKHCEKKLNEAKDKIEKVSVNEQGEIVSEDFI